MRLQWQFNLSLVIQIKSNINEGMFIDNFELLLIDILYFDPLVLKVESELYQTLIFYNRYIIKYIVIQ